MKKWIAILSGLLLVQLVLALAVNLTGDEYGAFESREKLLAFDRQALNGLRIEDEKQHVRLQRQDGKWLLSEEEGFPADGQSVEGLLDKLAALDKGWPVATTGTAAKRFKVADAQFERKLTLLAGDESLAELYVGTSPGFRKAHVRPAGADEIFAVAFNSWEASAKPDDWIDKDILKLDGDEVQQIEMPGVSLQRQDDRLRLTDLTAEEETDAEAVKNLLSKLTGLYILASLGTQEKPEWRQDKPALEIRLVEQDGKTLNYRFSQPTEETYYVLKRSDIPYYLKVGAFSVKPFLETTREKLVRLKAADEDEPQTNVDESGSATGGNAQEAATADSDPSLQTD